MQLHATGSPTEGCVLHSAGPGDKSAGCLAQQISQSPMSMVLGWVTADSAPCNSAYLRQGHPRTSRCAQQCERCCPAQGAQHLCLGKAHSHQGPQSAHLSPCVSAASRLAPHGRWSSACPPLPARGPWRSRQQWTSRSAVGARLWTWTGSSAGALTCSCWQLAQHLQLRPARQTG